MTVAETGSSAKRSSRKVLTVASRSVPTMTGATVSHRGDPHAARELSGLSELRSAVLSSAVHGGHDGLVHARRRAADLPRGGNRREDRWLAPAERRTSTNAGVPSIRYKDFALRRLRKATRALPHLRLPRR